MVPRLTHNAANFQARPREAKMNTLSSFKEYSEQFSFREDMKYNDDCPQSPQKRHAQITDS